MAVVELQALGGRESNSGGSVWGGGLEGVPKIQEGGQQGRGGALPSRKLGLNSSFRFYQLV